MQSQNAKELMTKISYEEIMRELSFERMIERGMVVEIYEKGETLKHFPKIGYKYRNEGDSEIRILLYGHYRIAYFINKAEHLLDIVGVFHGAVVNFGV